MHVLFVHQNYPAQFGHIARHLVKTMGWTCTFASEVSGSDDDGVARIQFKTDGGAKPTTHFCARTFENNVWHCDAVYHALKSHPDIQPDLIVGHSAFGSTLFLR